MNLFRSTPSPHSMDYPMPLSFASQYRAFPTYPQPPGQLEHPPWNGAHYWAMGPGQSWLPMGGAVAEARNLYSLYGPTAARMTAAARPYADAAQLMGIQSLPYGVSPASDFYFSGPQPIPAASELVVDIDPATGEAVAVDGRPAWDLAQAQANNQAAVTLSPLVANRPMPSITITARSEADQAACDSRESEQNTVLAVIGAIGLFLLLKKRSN